MVGLIRPEMQGERLVRSYGLYKVAAIDLIMLYHELVRTRPPTISEGPFPLVIDKFVMKL